MTIAIVLLSNCAGTSFTVPYKGIDYTLSMKTSGKEVVSVDPNDVLVQPTPDASSSFTDVILKTLTGVFK
jgi:hypothetical protein